MAFWNSWFGKPSIDEQVVENILQQEVSAVKQANTSNSFFGGDFHTENYMVNTFVFNGEKSHGELGNPINLLPDYRALRLRAYEADFTNDTVKIVTGKFFKWVIGTGLKLRSEPNKVVLDIEGIKEPLKPFRNNVESYFHTYASSTMSDYSGKQDLHDNARDVLKTSFLGGDCLTVLRVDNDYNLTVQVIDGQHICTPILSNGYIEAAKQRGNKIKHGVEIDKKGQHIAFYVVTKTDNALPTYERIEAKSKSTGLTMAWLTYGDKQRIDHVRGVSNLSAILEKVKKLDRYTEASVSAAEERAKIPFAIEHSRFSDGENPLLGALKKNQGVDVMESSYATGAKLAPQIAATANKQVWNMPIDSKLKALESNSEINYETFFKAIFVQICASMDLPPEVALQQYNSNYSASRAAINGFSFILEQYRDKYSKSFYKKVYVVWLHLHILKNKVSASGYLPAFLNENRYVVESYANSRFIGQRIPHIDPKKEADALRIMLGDPSKGEQPLITHEDATEQLGNGDFFENHDKVIEERELAPKQNATKSEN